MAKENPIPNSKPFKKGESGNKAGRPKRLVAGVTEELIKEGYTPVTASEVQQVYKTLLQLTEPRLKALVADNDEPMLLRIVAKAMLSGKGFEVIEKMMDRSHGRPANVLSLQKTETDPLAGGQQDSPQLSGINIVIVGGSRSLSGQVFSGVNWVQDMPTYFEDWVYCMDVGFANSYTTLAKVGRANGMMYGDELLYERGMNDKDIATRLTDLGVGRSDKIVIDSANAMLIDYLKEEHGFWAVPCKKRNVSGELSAMRAYTWNITDRSVNWKKEAKNYVYQKAKGGGLDNTPVKAFDHLWDAARYGFLELVNVNELPQFM